MQRIFVRELKPYSIASIAELMQTEESTAFGVVECLMVDGIVRYLPGCNPDGVDVTVTDIAADAECYVFNYVGLAMVDEWVFVCYPKYLHNPGFAEKDAEQRMRLVLRVLRRELSVAHITQMIDDVGRTSNTLPVMLWLLDMFDEYGEYSNYEQAYELNGLGAIDWNRTENRHFPIFSDGRPIYIEYETRKTRRDESDFIVRLHRAVLTECTRQLADCDVAEILGLPEIWLSDEEIDELGDTETLCWRIERERGVQFVTWKQDVLDALALYIPNRASNVDFNAVRSLGTSSFFHTWEVACKVAFGDLLDRKLVQLPIALANNWYERRDVTLLDIIPRPKWERSLDGEGFVYCGDTDTLIPDTVTFVEESNGRRAFCICDAKYYVPSVGGKMKGQPGVGSVTKQFLYQSAYREFVVDHGFDTVVNAFLIPGDVGAPHKMARVSFPGVLAEEKPPLSNHVDMWMLPAETVFEMYLRGERLDPKMFLEWCSGEECPS